MSHPTRLEVKGTEYNVEGGVVRTYLQRDGGIIITLKETSDLGAESLCLTPEEAIKLAHNILKTVKHSVQEHPDASESPSPKSGSAKEKG